MNVDIKNLVKCLSGQTQYRIPLFQRKFSWGKEQWTQLWNDLEEYLGDRTGATHFMGAVVVQQAAKEENIERYLIIDGQQRLTTFSLLLCALRDAFKSCDAQKAQSKSEEISDHYLKNKYAESEELRLKLVLSEEDCEDFRVSALGETREAKKKSAITQCYDFFIKKLQSGDFDLMELKRVAEEVACVALITLDEQEEPSIIFESLNNKGAALTNLDLIRNYALMKFKPEERRQVFDEFWKPLENILDPTKVESNDKGKKKTSEKSWADDFFIHYIRKATKDKGGKKRVYQATKSFLSSLSPEDTRIKLQEIRRAAEEFRAFRNPETYVEDREEAFELRMIRAQGSQFYSFLLALKERCQAPKDKKDYLACLRVINSFVLRKVVCGSYRSNLFSDTIMRLTEEIKEVKRPYNKWLSQELATLKGSAGWPSDEEFRNAVVQRKVSAKSKWIPLFFEAIEKSFYQNALKEFPGRQEATIEHIMPQTLSEDWKNELGNEAESVHEQYLNSLGNLTLTGMNSTLSNAAYAKKRKAYGDSLFKLNHFIAREYERWTAEDIIDRAQKLAEKAIEIWPRPKTLLDAISDK